MRLLPAALALVLLVACGDDDDDPRAASITTTTSTATTSCADEPTPPTAADGSPAEIVATAGDVQFAVVDRGASVDVVSLYRSVDCVLQPVALDGSTAALAVGGSVTHGDGIRCDGDEITILSATSDDGVTYQATSTTYRVEGTDLVQVRERADTIEAQDDPDELGAYYRLDC